MQSLIKAFFTVSFYTTFSRILGFVRDILIAKFLGSTLVSDAFFVAFRLPNFFRRVFAEGAYSAALIPVFSGIIIKPKNHKEALDFVENTMSFLLFFTLFITIIFYFCMPTVISILAPGFLNNIEAFETAVHFGKIIFPYLIFISLVAHFTSILNVHGGFAYGSFAPALLNISFILSLFYLTPYTTTAGHALSYGVLIGGILQFVLMYSVLLRIYKPKIIIPNFNKSLKNFFKLFIPGILGSGVVQLNIVIGTIIASLLPLGAISHIYYADRLNQLPLAIFGIALGIVLLPSLSKSIKENNIKEIDIIQKKSLEFSFLLSLPSAAGLYFLSEPIVYILFERGAFLSADTYYTSKVLSFFALGLPAYMFIKVLVVCFFAREDTKTPLYISIVSVICNVILSLILINSLREIGIALATAISAWVNTTLLYFVLSHRGYLKFDYKLVIHFIKIMISCVVMAFICYYLNLVLFLGLTSNLLFYNVLILLFIILFSNIIYFLMIFMLKVINMKDILRYIKK